MELFLITTSLSLKLYILYFMKYIEYKPNHKSEVLENFVILVIFYYFLICFAKLNNIYIYNCLNLVHL